jgi:hypothetical protein
MVRSLSTFAVAALLVAGCSSPAAPVNFPVSATLQPGQSVSAGSLSVTFIGVTNDSRCPAAAICITSGDATLQFALSTTSKTSTRDLQVWNPETRKTSYEGFSIEVETLAPYPVTFNSIRPDEYRATVKIDR